MNKKITVIDYLRIFACFFVVFYHYFFMLPHLNDYFFMKNVEIGFFKYGYLGVDLFFIISGFVITMSAEKRNAMSFIIARFKRLFPIYWISMFITSLFIYIAGHTIHTKLYLTRILTNLTMMPSIFLGDKTDLIDGSYWSLEIELTFYIFIAILLFVKLYKYLEYFSFAIILYVFYLNLHNVIYDNWLTYFAIGIIFYKIYNENINNIKIKKYHNIIRHIFLFISFHNIISISLNRLPILNIQYLNKLNELSVILILSLFMIIFYALANLKLNFKSNKFIEYLGLMTYPIYLLHNQIGKIVFTYFNNYNIYLIIFLNIIFVLIISFLIIYINRFALNKKKL